MTDFEEVPSVHNHLSIVRPDAPPGPHNHRTVDRVTQILEEVTYRPRITFTGLARALQAPKSSVHGFVRGLLAKDWLYEDDKRFYLGPAIYGQPVALWSVQAGNHLIYIRDRIASSTKYSGTQYELATVVRDQSGDAVAEITLVGSAADMHPREERLRKILLQHVDALGSLPSAR